MNKSELLGCEIDPVSESGLPFIGKPRIEGFREFRWFLAHCDNGVTWGVRKGDEWHQSSDVFPKLSPVPSAGNLQQIRLFDERAELLAWKMGDHFAGRVLRDRNDAGTPQWATPLSETWLLTGDRLLQEKDGFFVVGDGFGCRHAIPLDHCTDGDFEGGQQHPLVMNIRHYFERNEETGVVRIAATRVVSIENTARKETRK